MIYLIITSSILNKAGTINPEHRKANYINSIRQTLSVLPKEIKPIIVENNGFRETYLDNLGCDIHYTDTNVINYFHKGVNELEDIKAVITKYNIQDTDTVIKLTGRYHLLNSNFFNFVINNPNFDAYVKFYSNPNWGQSNDNDTILGVFAMKCKYLKMFEYSDFTKPPEVELATFCNGHLDNIYRAGTLSLRCCFADNLRIEDF